MVSYSFADFMWHLEQTPVIGSVGYLGLVCLLHHTMARRPAPVAFPKAVLVAYNAAQVLINAYVALLLAQGTGGRVWGIGMPDSAAVRHGVFLHYLCKYLDMLDTVIIVLRKKGEQLSFLHLWHHSTIVAVWGWVYYTWPAATGTMAYAYGAWVNSCVHVIMYFYYGLTAVGIKPPFKKLVTVVQLTQFASCIVHALTALAIDTTPPVYNACQVCYHIGMLKLFLPLLLGQKPGQSKPRPACPPFAPAAPKGAPRKNGAEAGKRELRARGPKQE